MRRPATTVLLTVALAIATAAGDAAPATATHRAGATVRPARPAATARQTRVSLVTEPQAGAAPFLDLISGARHSIELTMYELTDPKVEAALGAAARRGVDTRVLLNGGYYGERESTNAAAYRYLAAHGVHVRYTPTYFALTHQKTLTVDGRESAVMTLNFDGLYGSTRDYAIIDSQPVDVSAITSAFDADWTGTKIIPSSGMGDLVWSPRSEGAVLKLIDGAATSIELESEEMADTYTTDALCEAAERSVDVRIVMTYASDWRAPFAALTRCGAHIRLYHGQSYYIHAKLLDVDGTHALISSQNLSVGSLQYNRELGIDVTAPSVVTRLKRDFSADYVGAEPWVN